MIHCTGTEIGDDRDNYSHSDVIPPRYFFARLFSVQTIFSARYKSPKTGWGWGCIRVPVKFHFLTEFLHFLLGLGGDGVPGRGRAGTPAVFARGGETGRGLSSTRGRGSGTGKREIPVSPSCQNSTSFLQIFLNFRNFFSEICDLFRNFAIFFEILVSFNLNFVHVYSLSLIKSPFLIDSIKENNDFINL